MVQKKTGVVLCGTEHYRRNTLWYTWYRRSNFYYPGPATQPFLGMTGGQKLIHSATLKTENLVSSSKTLPNIFSYFRSQLYTIGIMARCFLRILRFAIKRHSMKGRDLCVSNSCLESISMLLILFEFFLGEGFCSLKYTQTSGE